MSHAHRHHISRTYTSHITHIDITYHAHSYHISRTLCTHRSHQLNTVKHTLGYTSHTHHTHYDTENVTVTPAYIKWLGHVPIRPFPFRPFPYRPVSNRPVPVRPDDNTECHFVLSHQFLQHAEPDCILNMLL